MSRCITPFPETISFFTSIMTGLKLVRLMPRLSLSSAVPHNYRSKEISLSPNGLAPRGINQIMLLHHCCLVSFPPSLKGWRAPVTQREARAGSDFSPPQSVMRS